MFSMLHFFLSISVQQGAFVNYCNISLKAFPYALVHSKQKSSRHFVVVVISFFKNRHLLEHNCFTIMCLFLLYNKMNQSYAYIYTHIPSLLSLPPTLPIPRLQVISKHQADLPVLCCCFSLFYIQQCIYVGATLTSLQLLSPHCTLKSILYVYIFIPALPLGSSVPFFFLFQFLYICVSIWYLFFSF